MAGYLLDGTLLLLLVICFYTDLTKKRIYNKVILLGVTAGLLLNCYIQGTGGLLFSLGGFGLGVALLFVPFAAGGMGAGDVKLLGMIGLFKGAAFVFSVFILAALLGGILSAISLSRQGRLLPLLKEILYFLKILFLSGLHIVSLPSLAAKDDKCVIPYGPALVLASVLVYFFPVFRF